MRIRSKGGKDPKVSLIAGLVVACVGISIGYAAFSSVLTIKSTAQVEGMSWKIEFQNLSAATLTGNAQKISDPVISEDKTELSSYNINFLDPGDSVTYTFQIANNGTIDAKLSDIIKETIVCEGYGTDSQAQQDANNVCSNLEYTLKYAEEENHYNVDGTLSGSSTDLMEYDILNAGDTKNVILTLKYKSSVDGATIEEPDDDVSISGLGITLVYSQKK